MSNNEDIKNTNALLNYTYNQKETTNIYEYILMKESLEKLTLPNVYNEIKRSREKTASNVISHFE